MCQQTPHRSLTPCPNWIRHGRPTTARSIGWLLTSVLVWTAAAGAGTLVSRDGRYCYYTSSQDIYRIDAEILWGPR